MEIKKTELKKGIEVDMPIEYDTIPPRQRSIRFKDDFYELFDIRTKRADFKYRELEDLLRYTNNKFGLKDIAVD